jgi:hypothetical protein
MGRSIGAGGVGWLKSRPETTVVRWRGKINRVRVGTPLGEYPFEFRRVRGQAIAIVGIVAGLQSSVIVDPEDISVLVRHVALPIGAVALFLAYRRSR